MYRQAHDLETCQKDIKNTLPYTLTSYNPGLHLPIVLYTLHTNFIADAQF